MGESTCKKRTHEGSRKDTVMRLVAAANDGAEVGHFVRKVLCAQPAYGELLSQ
jgi:hypothetical protein